MPVGEALIVADGWLVDDSPVAALSEPLPPPPPDELPLDPQTEHMAQGVAAALRSLMLNCAEPDGWLPPLLDEQRCAMTPLPWPCPLSPFPSRGRASGVRPPRAHLRRIQVPARAG